MCIFFHNWKYSDIKIETFGRQLFHNGTNIPASGEVMFQQKYQNIVCQKCGKIERRYIKNTLVRVK
jgi:hypothetical protein